jgi:hypothetical protein
LLILVARRCFVVTVAADSRNRLDRVLLGHGDEEVGHLQVLVVSGVQQVLENGGENSLNS